MVILECLLILHRLILTSKVAEENAFLEYVKAHYLQLVILLIKKAVLLTSIGIVMMNLAFT
jgi:hypothetical protein